MIYVHVPYCRSFCTYCGFYSERDCGSIGEYVDAVCREIEERRSEITEEVNTLYIGGGTPSVLSPSDLSRIVEAAGGGPWDEFTVELNPDDLVHKGADYLSALRALGVNRASLGVQSFDPALLKWMNRRHSAEDAVEAVRLLREAGFQNISIDLIFGIGDFAGQEFSDEIWAETLRRAVDLDCEHISAYQLSVESDSALEKLADDGRFAPADDEKCARQYQMICRCLADAGYRHYEVSNFAKPGFEAVHNRAYWRHVPYSGFGPGAHSLIHGERGWERRWNISDISKYIGSLPRDGGSWLRPSDGESLPRDGGSWLRPSEGEVLTAEQLRTERLMLGLRTDEGVPQAWLEGSPALESLLEGGKLTVCGGNYRIPEECFFVSDYIIGELI